MTTRFRKPLAHLSVTEIGDLIDRLHRKADAAALVAEQHALKANGVAPSTAFFSRRHQLLQEAKADSQYLWMLDQKQAITPDSAKFGILSGCFDAAAEAMAVFRLAGTADTDCSLTISNSLKLLAEALLSLRVALKECGRFKEEDHAEAFERLKDATSSCGVKVPFGMHLDDELDPDEFVSIAGRTLVIAKDIKAAERIREERGQLLDVLSEKALKHDHLHPKALAEMETIVERLLATGLQPSRNEFRRALGGISESLQATCQNSPALMKVVTAISTPRRPQMQAQARGKAGVASEVQKVADLLRGKSMVIIGGEERHERTEEIKRSFGLAHVRWISVRHSHSYRDFSPAIEAEAVAVVVLLSRFVPESFRKCKKLCKNASVPQVSVSGGYGVNQLAAAILTQAGDRLKAAKDRERQK